MPNSRFHTRRNRIVRRSGLDAVVSVDLQADEGHADEFKKPCRSEPLPMRVSAESLVPEPGRSSDWIGGPYSFRASLPCLQGIVETLAGGILHV